MQLPEVIEWNTSCPRDQWHLNCGTVPEVWESESISKMLMQYAKQKLSVIVWKGEDHQILGEEARIKKKKIFSFVVPRGSVSL